ncbi:hypothetical protein C0J52_20628 [Blattella germanica]|nr:hypothetical protein C0J52_20628 [Blattella germanica]
MIKLLILTSSHVIRNINRHLISRVALMSLCSMLSHSSKSAARRSRNVTGAGFRSWTLLPNRSHRSSMGFKSGLRAGQSSRIIPKVTRYSDTQCAACGRALSCMNTNSSPIKGAKGT